ncbi:MAG: GGDEF domain-containing protein [Rhizobiaceae bacterium]|nr:GGDEF domain-containing protein [Rhizobiaceae bacterium]
MAVAGSGRASAERFLGISPRGWRSLALWTSVGTGGCVAFSVAFNYLVFRDMEPSAFARGIAVAILLPMMLAGPLFFYLTLKLRELARLNHKLHDLATLDHVTGLLNRGALIAAMDAQTARMAAASPTTHLFLVVDADRFKSINDRFGHQTGDEALSLIAGTLRGSVRGHDLVGRLGGEEFGVLLLNVPAADATYVVDRLRRAVASVEFRPIRERVDLSVSIGGVLFHDDLPFSQVFRAADANLYAAKHEGRNRGVVTVFGSDPREAMRTPESTRDHAAAHASAGGPLAEPVAEAVADPAGLPGLASPARLKGGFAH